MRVSVGALGVEKAERKDDLQQSLCGRPLTEFVQGRYLVISMRSKLGASRQSK